MSALLTQALQLIYYFIPAYLANGSPPILAKLPFLRKWNAPVDYGRTWRGRRILGSHKTWRGVLGGVLLGGLTFLFQKYALPGIVVPFVPYAALPWWTGFLLAFGAIVLGDMGESFLKRRVGHAPGKRWIPWDQIDFTLGALLGTCWLFWPGWVSALFLLVFNGLLSAASNFIGGYLRVTDGKL